MLVGLEFDDEVDLLPDEVLGVADGDLRAVAVAENHEVDACFKGAAAYAVGNEAGEGELFALRGVADSVALAMPVLTCETVGVLHGAFEETALDQGNEQTKDGRPTKPRLADDLIQTDARTG